MTKDDMLHVLNYIAETDDACADGVFYALTLLSTNIGKMLDSVKSQIKGCIDTNRFSDISQLTKYCTDITELYDATFSCLQVLVKQHPQTQQIDLESSNTQTPEIAPLETQYHSTNHPVNYSMFEVDQYEEHTLDEDFEYRKVCGFSFDGQKYHADSWKDVLLQICGIVASKDLGLFESFIDDSEMNGKKNAYYSRSPELTGGGHEKNTLVPGTNVYVYTNASANQIAARIRILLLKYDFPVSDFHIFLRADYSDLHK